MLNINLKFRRDLRAASELTCHIPEIQRLRDDEHVVAIYEFQRDYYARNNIYLITGTISIVVVGSHEYLVDGQHRIAAYARLITEWPDRALFIAIDYYNCDNEADIETIYKHVNTCRPNKITNMSVMTYKIIKDVSGWLRATFKPFISASARPHQPNISLENIEKYIEDNSIIERAHIATGAEFIERIRQYNAYLSVQSIAQLRAWGIDNADAAINKIRERSPNLYIGLYKNMEWLDRIADNLPLGELRHFSSTHREKITSELRDQVWAIDTVRGKCYCCGDAITNKSFECGHVIPLARGGKTNAANLRPICRSCNRDMGTANLEDYKIKLTKQMEKD